MPPKKEKAKKGAKKAEDENKPPEGLLEVQKRLYELQITDCNRKLAKLRTAVDDYEQKYEQLLKDYDKLDEDRGDVITYLKKQLNIKTEENTEFKERIKALEEAREQETIEFNAKVAELEKNFQTMKDQLTSENKLLSGKLNALEEFRAIRDDLMRKYEDQEQAFKDQEMKYKRIIYETEKKFVIGKEQLKKEMEARLLKLAQDFQDATELRIAASTHRVIRENIALNNELDNILATQAKLATQNEKYKEKEKTARVALELAEQERDTAIQKNIVTLKVIEKLTGTYQDLKNQKAQDQKKTYDFELQKKKIEKLSKSNADLLRKVRILEQNLHAKMTQENKIAQSINSIVKESEKLRNVLREGAVAIQAALKLDKWAQDSSREIVERQDLLMHLLEILSKYKDIERPESLDSLISLGKVYEEGDLGFVPKAVKSKVSVTTLLVKEPTEKELQKSVSSSVPSSLKETSLQTIPGISILPLSSKLIVPGVDSLLSLPPEFTDEPFVEEELEKTEIEEEEEAQKPLEEIAQVDQQVTQDELDKSLATIATKKQEIDGEHGVSSEITSKYSITEEKTMEYEKKVFEEETEDKTKEVEEKSNESKSDLEETEMEEKETKLVTEKTEDA